MRRKTIAPIVLGLLLLFTTAKASPAPTEPTEQERIAHVLSRVSFGARPGDVELVQKMGVGGYVEQQLNPDAISDERVNDHVSNFASLHMSQEDIFKHYPQPQELAKELGIAKADQAANRARI